MASSAIPDIDALLEPLPGDNPAGDPHAYVHSLHAELKELRREERAEDYDDATRPEQLKRADWSGVVHLCQEALQTQSKDLRIACHLAEGAVKLDGFAGLRDSLQLLRRLVDECWDRLNPPVEDGDLDSRADPLANMLDDPNRGVRFPDTLRTIPLIGGPNAQYGLTEWNRLRSGVDPQAQDKLARAVAATPTARLQKLSEDIELCLAELEQLVAVLDARMGNRASGLVNVGEAISQCQFVVRQVLSETVPTTPGPRQSESESAGDDGEPAPPSARVLGSRADAYAQLDHAANVLQQLEPHSPIPYLVKRAVQLGSLPFPRLIKQLIRDTNVLDELDRELGVPSPTEESPV